MQYEEWREVEIDAVARRYLCRTSVEPKPPFGTPDWWACMTASCMRQLDGILSKRDHTILHKPPDVQWLPWAHDAGALHGIED